MPALHPPARRPPRGEIIKARAAAGFLAVLALAGCERAEAQGAACVAPSWNAPARVNAQSLRNLGWAPFRRPELGWETYAPLVAREIGSRCAPTSSGFARSLGAWQAGNRMRPTGILDPATFERMKGQIQMRRPFVQVSGRGVCPAAPPEHRLETARPPEGYGGKVVQLRPRALAAYRRMAAAARAQVPQVRADPRFLQIFSAYRSPEHDAARCLREGNCDGVVRATCSPHRTGLAVDIYLGQAPGHGPDSSADANRLFISRTPAYRWMVANAGRYGFTPYPFEPWHWEWTGEAP